tara:strand:+ start:467 stop:952 length:486 start_codon:yes stop_codon:yes gene_type:complete
MSNTEEFGRCELNTYVYDKKNKQYATLILDYLSNKLSMDPVNIFKLPDMMSFNVDSDTLISKCISKKDSIKLEYGFDMESFKTTKLSEDLIKFTDMVYYKNGLCDKVYYDSSLVHPIIRIPNIHQINFKYREFLFNKIDSIFYFKNPIEFTGTMWNNLYSI